MEFIKLIFSAWIWATCTVYVYGNPSDLIPSYITSICLAILLAGFISHEHK